MRNRRKSDSVDKNSEVLGKRSLESFEQRLNKKITRRDAISSTGKIAIGAAAAAIIAGGGTAVYFASIPPQVTTATSTSTAVSTATTTATSVATTTATATATQTITQTGTVTTTATQTVGLTGPDHPLVMAIGGYRPDMVKENGETFDGQFNPKGPPTEVQQLSGDLIAVYTTKLVAGAPLDIIYSYPYSTVTFSVNDWIQPVDDIKVNEIIPYNMSDIKRQLYPNWVDAFTVDGKFYGLPYYTSDVGLLLTNEKILQEAGMSDADYPTTWSEFYTQAETLQTKGFSEPILHAWYNEPFGIPWQWLLETNNRGGDGAMFETKPPYAPTFDVGSLAEDVLTDWKNAWDKGLVPHGVLTMKQTDYLGAFATGKFFYQPNGDYFAGFMNDPSKSQIAGFCSFVPPKQQPWGLIDTAALVLVNRKGRTPKDQSYAEALLEFMGYKDKNGNFYVPKKWAIQESLQSGFPAVANDPEVIQGFSKRLMRLSDLEVIRAHLETAKVPSGWKAAWYAKWNTQAQTTLPQIFTGEKTIQQVVSDLRKFGDDLVKQG